MELLKNITKYNEMLCDIKKYCKVQWNCKKFYDLYGIGLKYFEILWILHYRVLWNTIKYFKILYKTARLETLWDSIKYYKNH